MIDPLTAEPVYVAFIVVIFGGLYLLAEREYVRILSRQSGVKLPVAGAGLGWFVKRPWLIPVGVARLSQSLRERQSDPDVERARGKFLSRRRWIYAGAYVAWIAQVPFLLNLHP